MSGQKVENLLNLALGSTQREKEKSQNLMTGYNENERTWELIIRYDQSRSPLPEELTEVVPLSFGYGIIRVPEREIAGLAALEEVEYIEKPKRLYFAVNQGRAASCFTGLPASVEAGRLWLSLTREWTIFIRISGEKTEAQGSWHCGIRRWMSECLRKASGQEQSLPRGS